MHAHGAGWFVRFIHPWSVSLASDRVRKIKRPAVGNFKSLKSTSRKRILVTFPSWFCIASLSFSLSLSLSALHLSSPLLSSSCDCYSLLCLSELYLDAARCILCDVCVQTNHLVRPCALGGHLYTLVAVPGHTHTHTHTHVHGHAHAHVHTSLLLALLWSVLRGCGVVQPLCLEKSILITRRFVTANYAIRVSTRQAT